MNKIHAILPGAIALTSNSVHLNDQITAESILFPAFRAGGFSIRIKIQFIAVGAHPAGLPGRVAGDQGIGRHVAGDHSPGPDKGILPDLDPAEDGGIGADGSPFTDQGFLVFILSFNRAAGVDHIGKDHRRAEKNLVFAGHSGIDADIVLHFDPVTQPHSGHDDHILPQGTILPYDTAGHDMAEMPDARAFSDEGAGVDVGGGMNHFKFR